MFDLTAVSSCAASHSGLLSDPLLRAHEPLAVPVNRLPAADTVECSLADTGPSRIRRDVVERIRRQIASGDYLTEDKLDTTVARILAELKA